MIDSSTSALVAPSTTWSPLPRDEDGNVETSAIYGQWVGVKVTYNTDPEGTWVDEDDWSNQTLHGPFADEAEAVAWMNDYCPDDTDIKEVETFVLNAVR